MKQFLTMVKLLEDAINTPDIATQELLKEIGITYTLKWVICNSCAGNGTELRGGLKGADVTDLLEEDDDFAEDYFGGGCDTQCQSCEGTGKRKQPVVYWPDVTDENKTAFLEGVEILDEYNSEMAWEESMRAQGREF